MFGVHPDLRRHVAGTFVSSALLGLVGVAVVAAAAMGRAPVPLWAALVFGAVSLAVGWLGVVVAPRHYRESSRTVASVQPVPGSATLRLESDSDSTSLYARVGAGELALIVPRWGVNALLGGPVAVDLYVNPRTSGIVALRTDRGLLWTIPSLGADKSYQATE
jgi:hypothetical protein